MGDVVCYTYNSDVIESIWEYMPQNSFVLFCIAGTTLPMCSPFLLLHAPCLFITGCSPPLTWCSGIPASLPPCLQLSPPSQGWISSCQQQPDIGRFFFFFLLWQEGKEQFGRSSKYPRLWTMVALLSTPVYIWKDNPGLGVMVHWQFSRNS